MGKKVSSGGMLAKLKLHDFESSGWLLIWGCLIGLFTGAVAMIYRKAVLLGNQTIWGGDATSGFQMDLVRFLIPPLGGLLVGVILYGYLKSQPGHGVPFIIHSVQSNLIRIPWKMSIPSWFSVIVLTSGGSAGPEGPTAEIGAVFGSNMGRLLGAKPQTIRTLVGAGVAGAIAAVFSAPLGGVFFALEVIFQGFEVNLFAPVVLSAVVASLVSSKYFGTDPTIHVPVFVFSPYEWPAYIGLGILAGLLAAFFIQWTVSCSRAFQKIPVPLWLKPAIGGIGVGTLGVFLPAVIGEGYDFLQHEITSPMLAGDLFFLLVGKLLATGLTLGSGAPGGCFAPAIFIGGAFGGLYGTILNLLSPQIVTAPASYAVMGIAGMIAGTFSAPVTAILITLRMAPGHFEVLVPLMTTIAVVHFIMGRWKHVSVYTNILRLYGQWFPRNYQKDPLVGLTVGEVQSLPGLILRDSMTASKAFGLIRDHEETAFIVVNERGKFNGIITLNDLRLALADPIMGKLVTLGDVVVRNVPRLTPETSLRDAVHEFASSRLEALPVFNTQHELIGMVTRDSVLNAYRQSMLEMVADEES